MDRSKEALAEALWVEQNYGSEGPVFIASRIGALALEGDEAGVTRWKEIAAAFQSLQTGTTQ